MSDYSGWSIKYRVELDDLPTAYPDMVYSNRDPSNYLFEVFDVLRGDEEESTFVVVRIPEKIMRYDVVTNSFEKMIDLPGLLCYRRIRYTNVHRYTQILSSFKVCIVPDGGRVESVGGAAIRWRWVRIHRKTKGVVVTVSWRWTHRQGRRGDLR
ncbi:hypothetical protein R6Q57_002881 [Mikania cordata]